MPTEHREQQAQPRRRADAQRNIERILDAAVDALSEDLDANMSEIARRAGVVRATVYVHYPTRDALLEAVTDRALREAAAVIAAAEPERGKPTAALARVLAATWRTLGRYHALVAINTSTHSPEQLQLRHDAVLRPLIPLIERGQAAGAFRTSVPPHWHLAMTLALIHTASAETRAGRISDADAQDAVIATVLGAISRDGTT
ncbi:MAG: TetR/AcrR family transcriptional regulator [Solirubrobacteraceae bacterium]